MSASTSVTISWIYCPLGVANIALDDITLSLYSIHPMSNISDRR